MVDMPKKHIKTNKHSYPSYMIGGILITVHVCMVVPTEPESFGCLVKLCQRERKKI